jgi:glycosyltransferase involved in cell wall biosynthesis
MVLVEAMACGTPVIATRTGGIPEVVGDAGLLVAPLEPDALAEAVACLVRDASFREQLGQKARSRAVSKFDATHVARQIGDAYRQVLAGREG